VSNQRKKVNVFQITLVFVLLFCCSFNLLSFFSFCLFTLVFIFSFLLNFLPSIFLYFLFVSLLFSSSLSLFNLFVCLFLTLFLFFFSFHLFLSLPPFLSSLFVPPSLIFVLLFSFLKSIRTSPFFVFFLFFYLPSFFLYFQSHVRLCLLLRFFTFISISLCLNLQLYSALS
jgi:hypothetical protein